MTNRNTNDGQNSKKPIANTGNSSSITRRSLLQYIGAGAALSIAPPFYINTSNAANGKNSKKLIFASWGGSFSDAMKEIFFEPFEKETGIHVQVVSMPSLAKLRAEIKTGDAAWDLIVPANSWLNQGIEEGLWGKVDYSQIGVSIPSKFKLDYALNYAIYSGGMDWNTEVNPDNHPTTWQEFWDTEKFPGKRGLKARPGEMLECALMADGVHPKDIYPIDVDRAFKKLDEIKSHVGKWITSTEQTISLVAHNTLDYSYTYNGRAYTAKRDGLPIGFSTKQNILLQLLACIISTSEKKELALRLFNFMMRSEPQANLVKALGYYPGQQDALDLLDEKTINALPDVESKDNVLFNLEYWGKHNNELERKYKEFLLT